VARNWKWMKWQVWSAYLKIQCKLRWIGRINRRNPGGGGGGAKDTIVTNI
jgi:hypothetical protein